MRGAGAEPLRSSTPNSEPRTRNRLIHFPIRRKPEGIPVTLAGGSHPFPSRTRQLSLLAPMVLPGCRVGEWVVAGIPSRFLMRMKAGVVTGTGLSKTGLGLGFGLHGLTGYPVPDNNLAGQARSSVGEHYLDMVGVGGSIPPAPTTIIVSRGGSTHRSR